MSRIARVIAEGLPHHITQRGNFGIDVFESDDDRYQYLNLLGEYTSRYKVQVLAYCLMTNHVHFIVVPKTAEGLSRTFNQTHRRFSLFKNKQYDRRGHLWQARFYSCVLDEVHLLAAVRYVERNPVRAGIVDKAEDYQWSSANSHVSGTSDSLLPKDSVLHHLISDWSDFLGNEDEGEMLNTLRSNTRTGRPHGSDSFINRMESSLNRTLLSKKVGRPKK